MADNQIDIEMLRDILAVLLDKLNIHSGQKLLFRLFNTNDVRDIKQRLIDIENDMGL